MSRAATGDLERRLAGIDWTAVAAALDRDGCALVPALLRPAECAAIAGLYAEDHRFRGRVDMEPRRLGVGDYKYFARPLPPLVRRLQAALYPPLARIANGWMEALRAPRRFPPALAGLRALCRRHGQTRPTPLLLHYEAGGYNRLHQDLYGAVAFPIQATIALARPGADYHGGEFLLVEQRARMQSRGSAIALDRGTMILFPARERPVRGARGVQRAIMRHGVSTVTAGTRYTLGLIFHDAR
ncbi:MAG: 2OG-Fe(II) oxygenase [Candidatus Polarisedimenticolia bacterium]